MWHAHRVPTGVGQEASASRPEHGTGPGFRLGDETGQLGLLNLSEYYPPAPGRLAVTTSGRQSHLSTPTRGRIFEAATDDATLGETVQSTGEPVAQLAGTLRYARGDSSNSLASN